MLKKKMFYSTDTPHQQFQHFNKKNLEFFFKIVLKRLSNNWVMDRLNWSEPIELLKLPIIKVNIATYNTYHFYIMLINIFKMAYKSEHTIVS